MKQQSRKKKKPELLAPAGSYQSFLAAIGAGADAVYGAGARFGARAHADNFTDQELLQAIDYAHFHGRKFYLAVNVLVKQTELASLLAYIYPLYVQGLDGVIVQDIGVLRMLRRSFPKLEIHGSTQMCITGAHGAAFLHKQGVKRAVLARELSLEEVKKIRRETDMELECFVHGALCYAYSGRCFFSSFLGGRSGNRGECAQVCRLPYEYNQRKGYWLSLKDICTLECLGELIEAGVDSLKIEGRMRRPEYTAGVTALYRKYVDLYGKVGQTGYHVAREDREQLLDLFNRGGFHTGYYYRRNGDAMLSFEKPGHTGTPAAQVLAQKGRKATIRVLTPLQKGDILQVSAKGDVQGKHTLGEALEEGAQKSLLLPKNVFLSKGQTLFRIHNHALLTRLAGGEKVMAKPIKVAGFLSLKAGEVAVFTVSCESWQVTAYSKEKVQVAKKQELTRESVQKQLSKTGGGEFVFQSLAIEIQGHCFLSLGQLNGLRREALQVLKEEICQSFHREEIVIEEPERTKQDPVGKKAVNPQLSALVETLPQFQEVLSCAYIRRIYLDSGLHGHPRLRERLSEYRQALAKEGRTLFLAMPRILRAKQEALFAREFESSIASYDGVLVRNLDSLAFLQQYGYRGEILPDYDLYTMNRQAWAFWQEQGIREYTMSIELTQNEQAALPAAQGELLVYGYLPLMITAQCMGQQAGKCQKGQRVSTILDRYHREFFLKNYCESCYTVLYNSVPISLLDLGEQIERLGPGRLRFSFSLETGEETKRILTLWKSSGERILTMPFTRGHWKRGVL